MACKRSGVRIPVAPQLRGYVDQGKDQLGTISGTIFSGTCAGNAVKALDSRMARRDLDTVLFDHEGTACRDARYHRRCSGRWRGIIDLGRDGSGRRRRKKVSGRTKSDVIDRLRDVRDELDRGIKSKPNYTVQDAVDDWLEHGLDGRAAGTISTNKFVLAPLMKIIGQTVLKELTASEVRTALRKIGATRTSRTLQVAHNALERAISNTPSSMACRPRLSDSILISPAR
jgi:hypothetical protein